MLLVPRSPQRMPAPFNRWLTSRLHPDSTGPEPICKPIAPELHPKADNPVWQCGSDNRSTRASPNRLITDFSRQETNRAQRLHAQAMLLPGYPAVDQSAARH
jgi:hypothetical protein